ncbi:MAG: 30S ribosomal protein S16 [Planctomycetota bacterium]|nr:30S ribosomal protein S16 [Planctomycetota bacterium]MDA1249404.1 30S ribosomal protein S16 [Planctomycetota bacterium]
MVRIRLKRMGRTHRPFYRISVMDGRKARDGRSIEDIGYYDPMVADKSQRVSLKLDRLEHWLGVGAQPTDKVAVLIKKVKNNKWTAGGSAPALTAPKQPEPVAAPPADDAAAEGAEAPAAEGGEEAAAE